VARVASVTRRAILPLEAKLVVLVGAVDNIGTTTTLAASVSLSAVVTLLAAAGLLVMWVPARLRRWSRSEPHIPRALARDKSQELPQALWLWFGWVVLSFGWNHSIGKWAIQNLCVYAGFLFSADLLARYGSLELAKRVIRLLIWVLWIINLLYLLLVAKYGLGANVVLGARGTAIEDAIMAGAAVLAWRGLHLSIARFLPIVLVLAVTLSLSRMALAISILAAVSAFAVSGKRRPHLSKRALLRLLGGVIAAAGAFGYLAFSWAPLRSRFVQGDSAKVGGVGINTSGRLHLWAALWNHAWSSMTHVIIGQGAASSDLFALASTLNVARATQVADPHDDFLRMFYDFGVVGLVLFTVGMVALAIRAYHWAKEEPDRQVAAVHWASFLTTCALLGTMITDNPVTYSFCMLPYGALVGLSMGLARKAAAQRVMSEPEMQAPPLSVEAPLPGPRVWPSST
jgi:hypothetical protein